MPIFIQGEQVNIPLDQLIAKGRELIASGYPPAAPSFSEDANAAATALHWYDQQHREWLEANGDEATRRIRQEARARVEQLHAAIGEGVDASRVVVTGKTA